MRRKQSMAAALILCAAGLAGGMVAHAADCASVTINAFDAGSYDVTGFHNPTFDNYLCGDVSAGTPPLRNWFSFNIPVLVQPVASASLRIYTYDTAMPGFSEIFQLREVTTPVDTLRAGGSGLTGIYADLGDGAVYGSRLMRNTESYQLVTIPLGPAFLAKLAASSGGVLALGGQLVTLDGTSRNNEYLFGGSSLGPGTNAFVQLTLTYSNTSPLAIVEEPASATIPVGDGASFQVSICGGTAPIYQWQHFATNVPGATNPFLQIFPVSPADTGPYRVVVTDTLTNVTSAVATLTVDAAAPTGTIYFNIGQTTNMVGDFVMLCSSISGVPAPSYQWQFNSGNLPGQNNSCLLLTNVNESQSGSYRLVATNIVGAFTSAPISIVVTRMPPTGSIYLAGGSPSPYAGSAVTLCSTISGASPPSLQWQFNGNNLPGENNYCLYLSNVSSNHSGSYRIVATNSVGGFTSAPIMIAVQYLAPSGGIYFNNGQSPAPAGSSVTFCSSISAAPSPTYQWQFNGVSLPGQNSACLVLGNVSSNQAGSYRLVASNSVGAFTSAPISLVVQYFVPTGTIFFSYGQSAAPAGSFVRLCSTTTGEIHPLGAR